MFAPDTHEYADIVVVGGGCYGSYYVQQLERARAARKISFERLVVVDRDPECAVSRLGTGAGVVTADWQHFFGEYLASAPSDTRDAIVPSPLMPHLMYGWLARRAKARWPTREVATRRLPLAPDTPWKSEAPDGTHYASHATWICPVNCIEPRLCPHTRSERTWTMPATATELVQRTSGTAGALHGPIIFHCSHRAFGVGMFDTRDVVAADHFIGVVAAHSPADVLVGTVSHCHGAFNVLHVGAETA